jgi:hypothetical protein
MLLKVQNEGKVNGTPNTNKIGVELSLAEF